MVCLFKSFHLHVMMFTELGCAIYASEFLLREHSFAVHCFFLSKCFSSWKDFVIKTALIMAPCSVP